jgi:hypothetical protein
MAPPAADLDGVAPIGNIDAGIRGQDAADAERGRRAGSSPGLPSVPGYVQRGIEGGQGGAIRCKSPQVGKQGDPLPGQGGRGRGEDGAVGLAIEEPCRRIVADFRSPCRSGRGRERAPGFSRVQRPDDMVKTLAAGQDDPLACRYARHPAILHVQQGPGSVPQAGLRAGKGEEADQRRHNAIVSHRMRTRLVSRPLPESILTK